MSSQHHLRLAELISPSFPVRFPSSQVRWIRLDDAFRTSLQASQSDQSFVRYRSPKDSLSPADYSLLVTLRPQQLSVLSSPHVSHFYCMHPRSDAVLCLQRLVTALINSSDTVETKPIRLREDQRGPHAVDLLKRRNRRYLKRITRLAPSAVVWIGRRALKSCQQASVSPLLTSACRVYRLGCRSRDGLDRWLV